MFFLVWKGTSFKDRPIQNNLQSCPYVCSGTSRNESTYNVDEEDNRQYWTVQKESRKIKEERKRNRRGGNGNRNKNYL
jgi:hypothetical protein